MIDLLNLQPNKVSTNLSQYTMVIIGDTGVGKTTGMMNFLTSIAPEGKVPLFIEFEDRFQNIPGISAVKIDTMKDFKQLLGQLRIPQVKEKYSCLVIDTIDKYEEFCETFVLDNADAEILKDVGGYGEGNLRYKSYLRYIGKLQRLGYTVHAIAQTSHKKDFDTKLESDERKLTKNTFSYFRESAFLIGYMSKDPKSEERYITFKKSKMLPDLKDCFNLPDKIKMSELKEVWENSIEKYGADSITNDTTIDKEIKQEFTFDEVMSNLEECGSKLFDNGYGDDALAVLKRNLGIDNEGNVKSFDTLRESQIELAKVIALELEELVDKYNLK